MNIPLLQTEAWQKLQNDLKEESFFEKGSGYQFLAIKKSTPMGNYLYLPYGPATDQKNGFKNAVKTLKNLAEKHEAIFIRIEPTDPGVINPNSTEYKKTKDLNPKETWVLDLKGKEDDVKAKLPSRLLRYYKSAGKKGITIKTSHNPEDIKYLINLQKSLAEQKKINTFSENYLKTELSQPFATLYLVEYQNPDTNEKEIIASGLVFDDKTTRYNIQGAQNDTGRRLHATGILTIELILDAYKSGKRYFDFWGIAPENAPKNHPWAGFTNFKKTFAGYQVDRAGTYDIVLKRGKYRLYQLFRKFNLIIQKLK